MKPALKPGDVFAVDVGNILDSIINFGQRLYSHDDKSEYPHCGIIKNAQGVTFESGWHIKEYNMCDCVGHKVIIARYHEMDIVKFQIAYENLFKEYNGDLYPFWRLPMHLLPFVAKYVHLLDRPVCSELVAKFLFLSGVRQPCYMGTNVDTLVDEWKNFKEVDVVFEGIL